MKKLMKEFDECINTWLDLPKYVYTEEYRKAFIEFAEKRKESKLDLTGLAIWTLDHETGDKRPYFEFDRS